jgi:ubiquinone/menaquinone biosynthesis C-methylase UbiE
MEDLEQAKAYSAADFSIPNQRFADQLVESFPECIHRAIDIGCGSADIPIRLARMLPSIQITAVDASRAMIKLAQEGITGSGFTDRIDLQQAYLPGLPFRAHSFDTIISNSFLHHLPDPALFWREVAQLGSKHAVVFVMDLFRPDSSETAATIVESAAADEHPLLKRDFYNSLLAAFTVAEVKQQLVAAGLSELALNMVSERHWLVSGQLLNDSTAHGTDQLSNGRTTKDHHLSS